MNEDTADTSGRRARAAVVRSAAIYTPLFCAGLVLSILSIIGRIDAGVVLTGVEVLLTLAFGYLGLQAIRDLRATPIRTEGTIARRWSKMDFIITRSHYISVGRAIFRLSIEDWYDLAEGDRVGVVHYPHTATVLSVERLTPARDGA